MLPAASIVAVFVLVSRWLAVHRRSAAVKQWRPPTLIGSKVGTLWARSGGSGDTTIVLLHGLVASGDVFGAAYEVLAERRRLIIPDLLGFGRSLDESRTSFGIDDHLDALDDLVDRIAGGAGRVVVCGHSLGGAIAARWALRRSAPVESVVTWGAPVYRSPEAARGEIRASGFMGRLFVFDAALARRACAWNCRHRHAAGLVAAASEPSYPVALARQASLHTWPAYVGSVEEVVLGTDWAATVAGLDDRAIPIVLARGACDSIGDPSLVAELASAHDNVRVVVHETADHRLPLTDAPWCLETLGIE